MYLARELQHNVIVSAMTGAVAVNMNGVEFSRVTSDSGVESIDVSRK
jgi:hypothetical protein